MSVGKNLAMENLAERLKKLDTLLAEKKKTAAFSEAVPPPALPGGVLAAAAEAAGVSRRIRVCAGKKLRKLSAAVTKKYGAVSKEAAIVGALQAKEACGTDWGVSVTGCSLLPTPLTGDPKADGSTDISVLYIAVTDGRKAAVQQLECPSDLSDVGLRKSMVAASAGEAAGLLLGLLGKEPSAAALLESVRGLRRYTRSPAMALIRSILPWKGDRLGDIVLKTALIGAVLAVVITAGMTATERIAVSHTVENIQTAVSIYTEPPTEQQTSGLPEGYADKFAALYAVNEDVKGWLTIPDTNIDLPIMQAEDNDYYLSHDLYGEKDPYGLPYIDYRVPIEPDGAWAKNTLVYGHNMNAGYVFHELIGYRDAEFYKAHPFLTFDTVYNESEWVIFAAFEANTDFNRGEVFQYFNYVISQDPEKAQWYIDETTARSYFTRSVDVNTDDIFLTLQTCSNNATDTKLCIVARKLRSGESESDFDFSSSENNSARVKPKLY